MNIEQLRAFALLAEHENFTKVSKMLYISQPALSQMIARLEDNIGIQLFTRSGKKISLNSYGVLFLEYVTSALTELDAGTDAVKSAFHREEREISFTSTRILPSLQEVIVNFKSHYPEAVLKYNMSGTEDSIKKILNYEIEFAICGREIEDPRLECITFHKFPLLVILGKGHPLSGSHVVRLADLKDSSFICGDFTMDRTETETHCIKVGFKPEIALESNDFNSTSALLNQLPFAMLATPPTLLHDLSKVEKRYDTLACIEEDVQSEITLILRKKHSFTPIKQEFFDFICSDLKQKCTLCDDLYQRFLTGGAYSATE